MWRKAHATTIVAEIIHSNKLMSLCMNEYIDQMGRSILNRPIEKSELKIDNDSLSEDTNSMLPSFQKDRFNTRLVSSARRSALLFFEEQAINKAKVGEHFESAMDFIDMIPAQTGVREVLSNYLSSARVLAGLQLASVSLAEKMASYECAVDILLAVVLLSRLMTEPANQLYYARHAMSLIVVMARDLAALGVSRKNDSHGEQPTIFTWSEKAMMVAILVGNSAVMAGRAFPISATVSMGLYRSNDIIYRTLIVARDLQEAVLLRAVSGYSCGEANTTLYSDITDPILPAFAASAFLLDGAWKGWLPEVNFEEWRQASMERFLSLVGWSMNAVHGLLKWNWISRDSDEFLDVSKIEFDQSKVLIGRLPEETYEAVDGASFNSRTGHFELTTRPSTSGRNRWITNDDIRVIFAGGASDIQFTLDPPQGKFDAHPFQELKSFPSKALEGSEVLATLFHAN